MAYYNGVLGLTPTSVDDQGRGAEYELADGSTFGVWQGDGGQAKGGFVMFAVDDVNAAVPAMRERGVTFVADIMESPVCSMAPCMDPDGNTIIIHQRKQR
jgi:predicted enzyme related to lactoylglutathione lyase